MSNHADSYAQLAQQLVASPDVLDVGLSLAAPMHDVAMAYAYYVLGAFAALGLLISSVRERLAGDPGALRKSLVALVFAVIVIGYRVDFHLATGKTYEETRAALVEAGVYGESFAPSTTASKYEMSWTVVYAHRFVTHFLRKFIEMVNGMVGTGANGRAAIPMWAWEVWHTGVAADIEESSMRNIVEDYQVLCSGTAMANDNVDPEQWRAVGLLGGLGFIKRNEVLSPTAGWFTTGVGDVESMVKEDPLIVSNESGDASNVLRALQKTFPSGGVRASPRLGGYYIPSRDYWANKNKVAPGAENYIDVPIERLRYRPEMIGVAPSPDKFRKAFYPVTCLDLYYMNLYAFFEYSRAFAFEYHLEQESQNDNLLLRMWRGLTENEVSAAHRIALSRVMSGIGADTASVVRSWNKLFERFKLSLFVPMLIGAMALMYAFLVAVGPLLVAFSVLPGREGTLGLYLHLLAYVGVVLFLEYFLLAVGSALLASLTQTIGHSEHGYLGLVDKLAPIAIGLETLVIAGAVGILWIAKLFVFPDKQTVKGGLGAGWVAQEAQQTAHVAQAVSTAAAAWGVGRLARGMGDAINGTIQQSIAPSVPPGPPPMLSAPPAPQSPGPGSGLAPTRPGGSPSVWTSNSSGGRRRGIDIDGEFWREEEPKGDLPAPPRRLPPK